VPTLRQWAAAWERGPNAGKFEAAQQAARDNMNDELRAIAERLRTQDNRITAEPMFCVQEKIRIYGLDPQWSDENVWIDTYDGVCECEAPADEEETETVVRTGFMDRWETRMVAFTAAGCDEYIRQNGHNHSGELRIYVESFRRCPEMIAIRAMLMAMAEPLPDEPAREPKESRAYDAEIERRREAKDEPTIRRATMDKAERIVHAIERDFTDRRGLRQEWEQIDAGIQAQIRATWIEIVRKELAKDE
jgi:hypothetical protein